MLQDRHIRPVGATTSVRADFRLICATNVDMVEALRQGEAWIRGFQGPMALVWGERDRMIPVAHGREAHEAMPGSWCIVYDDAGHGFHCDQRGSFDAGSAKLARGRTLEFFRKHLG